MRTRAGQEVPSNKREALRKVASWTAGLIDASSVEEATGLGEEVLTEAESARLAWAMEEVARRLWRMGGRAQP